MFVCDSYHTFSLTKKQKKDERKIECDKDWKNYYALIKESIKAYLPNKKTFASLSFINNYKWSIISLVQKVKHMPSELFNDFLLRHFFHI